MKRKANRFVKVWKLKRKLERWAKICGVKLEESKPPENIPFGHSVFQDANAFQVQMPPCEVRMIGWDFGLKKTEEPSVLITIFVNGKPYQMCGPRSMDEADGKASILHFVEQSKNQLPTMFVSEKEAAAHGN